MHQGSTCRITSSQSNNICTYILRQKKIAMTNSSKKCFNKFLLYKTRGHYFSFQDSNKTSSQTQIRYECEVLLQLLLQ